MAIIRYAHSCISCLRLQEPAIKPYAYLALKKKKGEERHRRRRSLLALSVPELFAAFLVQVGDILPENGLTFDGCNLFEFEDKHGYDVDEDNVQDYKGKT